MNQTKTTQHRIVIIGTSGSGKSTLARKIAALLNVPQVELDAFHWEPHWTEASPEIFRKRVQEALQTDSWVVDGNYGKVRDLIWRKAQTIIWLDYPFHIVLSRTLFRTLKRVLTREILWAGNRESPFRSFFSKESILLWVIKTYSRRKLEYPALFKLNEYQHIEIIHLHSQYETTEYLKNLAAQTEGSRSH